jgi:hypothetical protein
VLGSIPEGDVKQEVANELAPRRAIAQDAVVAVVFLAASWLFGRVL